MKVTISPSTNSSDVALIVNSVRLASPSKVNTLIKLIIANRDKLWPPLKRPA